MRVPANPIPRKEEIYRAMANGKLFSAMDLLWGFYQVRLREDSIPYTAFSTPDGLYEYLVTSMGVSSSPSCFNRLVQAVFSDQQSFCQTYFDDIFVFTPTDSVEEHLTALEKVFQRCVDQKLYIKLSKCKFCADEIPCLGDFIGREGVRMDPAKGSVIKDWPVPRTKHQLQSFLGTCVYVLRFCRDFAALVAPLTELTKGKAKNDSITFSEVELNSFHELKTRLAAPPALAHPDFSRPFHVSMDASDFAIGGYLFQRDESGREQVIAYGGRKLTRAEVIYPTREKELLAALHAMRLWKVYLIDRPFYINTDHHTIATILQQQTCSQRLARWLNELALFQPMFQWIEGASNIVADMTPRKPIWNDGTSRAISLSALLESLTTPDRAEEPNSLFAMRLPSLLEECRRLGAHDSFIGPILKRLQEPAQQVSAELRHFQDEEGLLYFQPFAEAPRRLCIPEDTALRNRLLF
ncbi:hypothetical protein PR001_g18376 [Phytophthora rubi]|uniref:Reverse transcriptase domain-containing protein n=1 Tax=Phytophthora rubi TaxID=129364 RepID=A0A6A3KBC2_9STRA|nr:hypothetical protein PR001_g18376 [Phytophthora rubi]